MAFDYTGKLTALYNVLSNANTTTATYDLSKSLDSRIKIVSKADPTIVNLRNYQFPAVFCKIESKTEDFDGIGGTGETRNLKEADVTFQVVGLYKKYGATTSNEDLLADVYQLADNIESVIREDCTLSGTASWAQPESTDFVGPFEGDGTLVKGCLITVRGKYYFR
jgi:hypothetical protein